MHTVTSDTLLEALRDPGNQTVWRQWVDRYRPVVFDYARRLGLAAEDAEDVAQDALIAFANAYRDGRYERARGRLRSWLFGIAHRTVCRFYERKRPRELRAADAPDGMPALDDVPAEDAFAVIWEEEWRAAVLAECLAAVRAEVEASTFEAFRLFVQEELPAREVAACLGVTENAVYGAKRRVLARVRELRPQLEEIW